MKEKLIALANKKVTKRDIITMLITLIAFTILLTIIIYFSFYNKIYEYPEEEYQILEAVINHVIDTNQKVIKHVDIPNNVLLNINTDTSNKRQITVTVSIPKRDASCSVTLSQDFEIVEKGRQFSTPDEFNSFNHSRQITASLLVAFFVVVFIWSAVAMLLIPFENRACKKNSSFDREEVYHDGKS